MAEGTVRTLYFTGIQKLRDRYKLCIDKDGDYVEKMYAHLSLFYLNRLGSKLFARPSYVLLMFSFLMVPWETNYF